jgi:pimeloyl-ACP methyl ester carboxylesterase
MTRLYELEIQTSTVQIPLPHVSLEAILAIPDGARSIVVFAQGRGSSRNNAVDTFQATQLQHAGFATLLLDLYTPKELQEDQQDAHLRFNVRMLGDRLTGVADWLIHHQTTHHMAVGFLAASTGAAATLIASANRPETIQAIACRSARPDLAGQALQYVTAPTLLVVGERDPLVLSLNELAMDKLSNVRKLVRIPRAGHDFEEPGVLEEASGHILAWFTDYLTPNRAV